MRRLAIVFLFTALLFPLSDSVGGGNVLDIQAELARPGVKLLVVEFYATGCKPCMEAAPKWKALHEKYKKAGLRFIVVSAEEDKSCARPPAWSPDKTLCDADWSLMKKMGVQKLPTSFLYSWEGRLAMKSHQVAPVENAIRSYFKDTHYKIEVDQVQVEGDAYAVRGNPNWVQDEVAAQIRALSRFDVVASSAAHVPQKQADACDNTFPPNSVLRITLRGYDTGERTLTLVLEKDGCQKAISTRPYKGNGLQEDRASLKQAVDSAVQDLMSRIVRPGSPKAADSLNIEWVSLPGGSFTMGCSPQDRNCDSDETPAQRKKTGPFSIMKYEVTQGQYALVTGKNPSHFNACGKDCPVENVSWHDAVAFCGKVGGRLPGEVEWEYAARAGKGSARYGEPDAIAWYRDNSGGTPHPVGAKQANAWDIYDMLGNVWEWVDDCYGETPQQRKACVYRVNRGGSWMVRPENLRASFRSWLKPEFKNNYMGFRCARDR